MDTSTIDGRIYVRMLRCASENLRRNREIVNDLNVFPIPDGDTGDNMYMTVQAGCDYIKKEETHIEKASAEAARGMLLGARGNSGVILSRIFSGIADGLAGNKTSDVQLMCDAFKSGVKKAYGAVSIPVEGTILTVYREAAEYVSVNSGKYAGLAEMFDDFLVQTRASLERTPELLEVLKRSGVVDSGGAGLYYIVEGMKKALDGWDDETADTQADTADDVKATDRLQDDGMEYGYCTEFLLQLMPSRTDIEHFNIDDLKEYLKSIGGESIVAFKEEDIIKVHVHIHAPGIVLNYCQQFGEYLKIKSENMTLQHENAVVRNRFPSEGPKLKTDAVRAKVAVVAVAAGEGIKKVFTDAGTDAVIDGGQSMNPSAEAFIKAFDEVNADTVIVLPNNKNIILTARQAAELYKGSDIRVFESRSIGEGYAAISMLDKNEDVEAIIKSLHDGAEGVVTAMVSRAVRNSNLGDTNVKEGEYIGFAGDKIYACDAERRGALLKLAAKLNAAERDVLMIFCGADATDEDAGALYDALSAQYKSTEVIILNGGQPIYDFLIILE